MKWVDMKRGLGGMWRKHGRGRVLRPLGEPHVWLVGALVVALGACADIETAPPTPPGETELEGSAFSWLGSDGESETDGAGEPSTDTATGSGATPEPTGERPTDRSDAPSSSAPASDEKTEHVDEGLPEGIALDGFALETYAIGDNWYDYDGRTHVLTPREEIYRVGYRGNVAFLAIESYYGPDGNSGWFELRWRLLEGGELGPAISMQLSRNVKEREVCVAIDPPEEVTCRSRRAALRFRTDARVIPPAGFSVTNPALYEAQEPGEEAVRIVRLRGVSLDGIPEEALRDRGLRPRPSVAQGYEASVLGRRHLGIVGVEGPPTFVQASASMRLVQWRVLEIETLADAEELHLQVRCVPLASSPGAQTDLSEAAMRRASLALQRGNERAALIRLCGQDGPEIVEERDGRFAADWPDTRTFDLIAEQTGGRLWLRAAPGAMIWNAADAAGPDFEGLVVPYTLWD